MDCFPSEIINIKISTLLTRVPRIHLMTSDSSVVPYLKRKLRSRIIILKFFVLQSTLFTVYLLLISLLLTKNNQTDTPQMDEEFLTFQPVLPRESTPETSTMVSRCNSSVLCPTTPVILTFAEYQIIDVLVSPTLFKLCFYNRP